MQPVLVYMSMGMIDKIEPPTKLHIAILAKIGKMERRRAMIFLLASAQIAVLSVIGIVFSIRYVVQSFYESNFYAYFSLLLSDPDIVLIYWKDFALSLADTIPFMEITITLMSVSILLISVKILAKNMQAGISHSFSS